MGLRFWAPVGMRADSFFLQILVSAVPMLAFTFAGIGIGVVFKRWGPNGLWAHSILGVLLFGGLAVLITGLQAWDEVGSWLVDQSLVTLAIGLPLALAVVAAALSYVGIRRVVP